MIAHKRKTNAKNFVVKIMSRMRKVKVYTMKEGDSNKLLIEDVSGGEALSFWSRIVARHIHQPRQDCHLIIVLIITDLHLFAPLYALIRYYYATTITLL